jgi:4a-hydroxytetrahydrobiopterin dehydratase
MNNWTNDQKKLQKEFVFESFDRAIDFMVECSVFIGEINHHPEWSNIYNRVMVTLTTHDAGNVVTEKDYQLAEKMDEVYSQFKH